MKTVVRHVQNKVNTSCLGKIGAQSALADATLAEAAGQRPWPAPNKAMDQPWQCIPSYFKTLPAVASGGLL